MFPHYPRFLEAGLHLSHLSHFGVQLSVIAKNKKGHPADGGGLWCRGRGVEKLCDGRYAAVTHDCLWRPSKKIATNCLSDLRIAESPNPSIIQKMNETHSNTRRHHDRDHTHHVACRRYP